MAFGEGELCGELEETKEEVMLRRTQLIIIETRQSLTLYERQSMHSINDLLMCAWYEKEDRQKQLRNQIYSNISARIYIFTKY